LQILLKLGIPSSTSRSTQLGRSESPLTVPIQCGTYFDLFQYNWNCCLPRVARHRRLLPSPNLDLSTVSLPLSNGSQPICDTYFIILVPLGSPLSSSIVASSVLYSLWICIRSLRSHSSGCRRFHRRTRRRGDVAEQEAKRSMRYDDDTVPSASIWRQGFGVRRTFGVYSTGVAPHSNMDDVQSRRTKALSTI
jgi:hypothetical protein